ncbi:MAG: hypothetical protein ACO26C_08140 [Ilumatobacteraceae bacterium]
MNSKSATPSGSQRARAPGGWMKASAEAVRDLLSGLPQPWSTPAMLLDLDAHADREAHTGEPMPGRRALAARWGVGERVARTVIDRWHAEGPVGSARHRPAAVPVGVPLPSRVRPGGCPAEDATMPMDGASVDENRPASVPPPVPGGVPVPVPGVVENVCSDACSEGPSDYRLQTQTEKKKRTRKAKPEALSDEAAQALLDRMHAIAAEVEPRTRKPALGELVKPMRYCAGELVALAQETGRTPEGIIEAAWLWFWTNPDPWHRTNLRGLRGYAAVLRPDNATSYAGRQADIEAAKAPPAPQTPTAPVRDAADDAWDVWVSGIEEARAWVAARRGSREAAAFTEAMERAVHPNPIAEFYGALSGKRDRAMAREVFIREFRSRTALRLVSK